MSKRYRLYQERNTSLKATVLRRRRAVYKDLWALQDVSFDLYAGEFLALVGPNGAGKSTLMKVALGLVTPLKGHAALFGADAGRHPERVGYVPQLKTFDRTFPATVSELVVSGLRRSWPTRIRKDERAAELGMIFAAPAAIAVQNAHALAQTRRLAEQLQAALESRGVVDRAVGIMMSRSGGTETEAMERLRELSQTQHRKLVVVARSIVDEAVRRANARHRSGADDATG